MQFYDEVTIQIESGRWWNWLASGRREAGVPFWWPNGGDGGKWWDVVFVASKHENTLLPYRYKKIFKAKAWEDWRTKDQYGANGESLFLNVPVGTIIKDMNNNILWALNKDGEKWIAMKWGEWWLWNIHFKDAVNQYPNFAILGEPAHKKEIKLELQLLADVALVWSPSVGKSSLINSISHTKAKVADYPFTTLIPNLGSINVWDYHFNMIDIPGLIKWASEGKWLWNAFLRHILKARILCFIVDLARLDNGLDDISEIFFEISKYIKEKINQSLEVNFELENGELKIIARDDKEIVLDKKILFVINKYDLINDEEIVEEYKKELLKHINKFLEQHHNIKIEKNIFYKNCFTVSAATHYWLEDRTNKLVEKLKTSNPNEIEQVEVEIDNFDEWETKMVEDITDQEKAKLIEEWYIEEINAKYSKVWYINNPEICKMVFTLPWGNDEWEVWFWKNMDEKGYIAEFDVNGIKKWDVLKIKSYYESEDDKYILY